MEISRRSLISGISAAIPFAAPRLARAATTINAPVAPADATVAINGALRRGIGRFSLPAGTFNVPGGVVIPNGVKLEGEGQNATALYGPVFFADDAQYSELHDLCVVGPNSTGINAITVPAGALGLVLRDIRALGGSAALFIEGTDCRIDNCFFGDSYGLAAVVSNGANFYIACKIDSQSGPSGYIGFYQGNGIRPTTQENHLADTDFSGAYAYSIVIEDANSQAATTITGGIISSPCLIGGAAWTCFNACEIGADIINSGSNPCTVANCWSRTRVRAYGNNVAKHGNINIS